MKQSIIRTDKWHLSPTTEVGEWMSSTVTEYRAFCKALSFVVMGHWVDIAGLESPIIAVERLIHQTAKNPTPLHGYFGRRFYKFPSYLRRAAIQFVCGQVSSFHSRYRDWQDGIRSRRDALPPRFSPEAGCYPVLYRGNCFKLDDPDVAQIKVWNGSDWVWAKVAIVSKRERHLLEGSKDCSPSLIVRKGKFHLSVPFRLHPDKLTGVPVCSVDVGINTLATCSIVYPDGTVTARMFVHPGVDIDRRDRQIKRVQVAARKTGKLFKGFCKTQYRKARQYNRNIAQSASRQVVNFALEHGASVIVLEDLKGWRPKGGKKRSALKQRFHGWLHRQFVACTEAKFVEAGGKVHYVYARGTSSWAFDGSGKVKRDARQYELCTFKSGKRYNADLSASYNIAARYWAFKLKLTRRNDGQVQRGKSSDCTSRMPIVLSDLWSLSTPSLGQEAPHESFAS
jgi:putative transposase